MPQPPKQYPTENAKAFAEGRRNHLTYADIDPVGAQLFANYEAAMEAKRSGSLQAAAELLEKSCNPPTRYHGHYRELFQIWRRWNSESLTASKYTEVVCRVRTMARYDNEMIQAFFNANGWTRRQKYPVNHFDCYRNLKITDVKNLRTAASALVDTSALQFADELENSVRQRR